MKRAAFAVAAQYVSSLSIRQVDGEKIFLKFKHPRGHEPWQGRDGRQFGEVGSLAAQGFSHGSLRQFWPVVVGTEMAEEDVLRDGCERFHEKGGRVGEIVLAGNSTRVILFDRNAVHLQFPNWCMIFFRSGTE